jgi:hypothetical protein
MDFYADAPMPSIEQRVATLLTFVENPTDRHIAIANQVASETKRYSLMGYSMGNIATEEKLKFLQVALSHS